MEDEDKGGWKDGKYVLALSKPLPNLEGGADIVELVLREPTGLDMMEAGNPVIYNPVLAPDRIDFDERKLAAMISRVASQPMAVIKRMSPKDMINAGWSIAGFFLPV